MVYIHDNAWLVLSNEQRPQMWDINACTDISKQQGDFTGRHGVNQLKDKCNSVTIIFGRGEVDNTYYAFILLLLAIVLVRCINKDI